MGLTREFMAGELPTRNSMESLNIKKDSYNFGRSISESNNN